MLVERSKQMSVLRDLVSGVASGLGGVVLVVGEHGVGKSALLSEGLAGAAGSGCRVCWSSGNELGQRIPLGLITRCLGEEGLAAAHATAGGLLAGDPVAAGAERLCALVEQWCARGPVIVVAEDLHWADEASVLVWRRLARVAPQMQLLVAGSARTGADAGVAALRRWAVASGGAVLPLEPLAEPGVAELAAGLAGGVPGARLRRVLKQAGGNPLYARELVDALVRDGRVAVAAGTAELAGDAATGDVRIPVPLRAAISERLGMLPGPVSRMLRCGVVLAGEFSIADLALVSGQPAADLALAAEQALMAGVLAETADGARLRFRHPVIRQVLYEQVPRRERAALQQEAARAEAAGDRFATGYPAADLHFAQGEWDEVLTTLETMADMPGAGQLPILEHGLAALIAGHRDDSDMAAKHLGAVAAEVEMLASPAGKRMSYFLLLAQALAAERAGQPEEAVTVLARCLDESFAAEMPHRYLLLPALGRAALAAGDAATAAAAARAAHEDAEQGPLPVKTAAADCCQGLAAGDPAPLLAAAGYYQATSRQLDWALALEDVSVLLARRGDLAGARTASGQAALLYQELGATWDLHRSSARLKGCKIRRSARPRRPARGWDALTPTELKIARLVAEGLSNPDIAAQSFLSRNTVQTHISHILAKLGAPSRAEIIRQALSRSGSRLAVR